MSLASRGRVIGGAVLAIAAAKLLIHLYAGRYYGYFVDELYYLACSRHLGWGYVDHPPLIAVGTRRLWRRSLLWWRRAAFLRTIC